MQPNQKAQPRSRGVKVKTVIGIILTLLALSVSYSSYADEQVVWSWQEVTEDTLNNPITVDEYRLYCNDSEARVIIAPILTYVSTLANGTYACYVKAIKDGVESEPSNIVTKVVQDAVVVPKAPILNPN